MNKEISNTGIEANKNEIIRLASILSSETITTNIVINVVDENNMTVNNATVKIDSKNFITDENGYVLIENIQVNKTFQVILNGDYSQ